MKPVLSADPRIVRMGEAVHVGLRIFSRRYNLVINRAHHIRPNLCGGCAIGAATLVTRVRSHLKLDAHLRATYMHAWCEVDGIIYDPTAYQFGSGFGMCHVTTENFGHYDFECVKSFSIKDLKREGWPMGQHPDLVVATWHGSGRCTFMLRNAGTREVLKRAPKW